MTLAEAVVKFSSNGVESTVSGIKKISSALDDSTKKAQGFTSAIASTAIGTAIGNKLAELPSQFLEIGKSMFNASVEAESMNARMMAMSKSAAAASKDIELIKNIALVSPITTKDTYAYALALKSVGFNLQFALPLLAKMAAAKGASPERLQAFTQVMTKLATGIMPDAEQAITAGIPGLREKLANAGLKLDPKGSIVASAKDTMLALQKVVQQETGKAMDLMSKTTETKLASFQDALNNFYIKGGDVIKKFFTPMIEAATKALDLLSQSGALTRLLETFFQPILGPIGDISKNYNKNGLTDQGLMNLAKIMATISVIPENIRISFDYMKDIFNWFLQNLSKMFGKEAPKPAPLGMSQGKSRMDYLKSGDLIGAMFGFDAYKALTSKGPTLPKVPTMSEMIFGLKPGQTLADQFLQGALKNFSMSGLPSGPKFKSGDVTGFYNDLVAGQKKAMKDMKVPEPTGPPGDFLQRLQQQNQKDQKNKEKNTNLLDLIVQNTQKANELTLRNMTYGGGQLAASGISAVQMANYKSVGSPRINATNDITRGVKKEINATTNSNFLNFSPRRS